MDEAARLVEVLCPANIRRYKAIVTPSLINAVNLDRQHNWDPTASQFTGELVDGGSAPTVPEKNDAGILLLFIREAAVSICVEPVQDLLQRLRPSSVFECDCMELWSFPLRQTLNDSHFRMALIVVRNEPAKKTHDDDGGSG